MDKPLYFYHIVNKDVDMSKGLLSLKYMYDNKMYDLFDKYVDKYKERIVNYWNIDKYKNKNTLTREEYLDGLKCYRGDNGDRYIYFFRYQPLDNLGSNMSNILKYKDIYRININDPKVKESIEEIFYGYDMSNSDNNKLDREYYEKISEEEYFSKYDDSNKMLFSTLNHIGIVFKDDYCKIDLLEKM